MRRSSTGGVISLYQRLLEGIRNSQILECRELKARRQHAHEERFYADLRAIVADEARAS
jgi:hypothetical protein